MDVTVFQIDSLISVAIKSMMTFHFIDLQNGLGNQILGELNSASIMHVEEVDEENETMSSKCC